MQIQNNIVFKGSTCLNKQQEDISQRCRLSPLQWVHRKEGWERGNEGENYKDSQRGLAWTDVGNGSGREGF